MAGRRGWWRPFLRGMGNAVAIAPTPPRRPHGVEETMQRALDKIEEAVGKHVGETCVLCRGQPAQGFAVVNGERYCHGDGDSQPTCYMRATWTSAGRHALDIGPAGIALLESLAGPHYSDETRTAAMKALEDIYRSTTPKE